MRPLQWPTNVMTAMRPFWGGAMMVGVMWHRDAF